MCTRGVGSVLKWRMRVECEEARRGFCGFSGVIHPIRSRASIAEECIRLTTL